MGVFECDDGNTKSGDGCSKDCKVEPFYECSGGDYGYSDICINRKPPEIKKFKYYGNLTAIITFEKTVRTKQRLQDILELHLEGAESNVVAYELIPVNPSGFKKVQLALKFNCSLYGSEVLIMTKSNQQ